MSRYKIYSSDGILVRCEVGRFEYNGEFMGGCYLTMSVKSNVPIDFAIGDYMDYRGERFSLNYIPSGTKRSSAGSCGDAFVYDDLKLNSASDELTRCDFLDVVPNDNGIHFTGLPQFSFYAQSVRNLAERIQANLDRVYTGDAKWRVVVSASYNADKSASISAQNIKVWDALAMVNSEFGANFTIRGREIVIGGDGLPVDGMFKYGKGKGLFEIARVSEQDQLVVTRLRAYGSEKNMPYRYYNKMVDGDGWFYVPNHMAVNRLMLPDFPKVSLDPYIDSDNIGVIGVRESTVVFDGSDGNEEIYPSMGGMTAKALADAGIYVSLDAGDNGNLDEVKWCEPIADDGVFEEGENVPLFKLRLKDIGFDINDHLTGDNAKISMLDGMCGGREFEITSCKKFARYYELTCKREEDSSLGMFFPSSVYAINAGDRFTLTDIAMPDVYIQAASYKLLEAARDYLSKNDYARYSYSPSVDEIFMARQHDECVKNGVKSIHDTIKEGDLLMFSDDDLSIDGTITIDKLTITENDGGIPKYDITLKEEKTVGRVDKIQNKVDSISDGLASATGYTAQQIEQLVKTFGRSYFLSRNKDDRTSKKLSSDVGFEIGNFVSGTSGAMFYRDAETGHTVGEIDKLYVRMKAYFENLEIVNVNSVGGKVIVSPAGSMRIIRVEHVDGGYKCYLNTKSGEDKVDNRFVVGDLAYCETFNVESYDGAHGNRYYWRIVDGRGDDYVILSDNDFDRGSDAPAEGDVICQFGNRRDVARQNAIVISSVDAFSPSISLYSGVKTYSLENTDAVSFGVDKTNGQPYMNVYGNMFVGSRDGSSYMRYTKDGGLEVKGKLAIGTTFPDGRTVDDVSEKIDGVEYLTDAIEKNGTSIEGGLVQTTALVLGYNNNGKVVVMAGSNGLYDETKTGGGVASWWGGNMIDRAAYSDTTIPVDAAKALIRFDGSGYFADGAIYWGTDGYLHADPNSFIVNENQLGDYIGLFGIKYKVDDTSKIDYIIPRYWMDHLNVKDGLRIGDVWLRWDAERSAVRVESAVSGETVGLYADGWLSAGGANASAGGGGGSSFDLLQLWENYNGATAQQMALSAYLGKDLKDRIEAMHVPSKVSELENDSGFVDGEEVDGRLAAKADKATTLDGYGISDAYTKTESDEAAKDMRKTGYAMTETIIDTSALNTDTFYPVTMQIPQTARVRIEIVNSLDGGLPSGAWGGSDTRGPSVFYAWYATGNGWGARNGMNRTIIVAYRNATWTRVQVVGGIWQMSNSSTEYVYVRGGTKWRFRTSHGVVPILRTSRYEVTNQYVAPRTDAPDEPVMNLLADSANKLSTKRSIFIKDATATHIGTPTDFDGSEAVTLLLPDTIDAELNGNAGTAGKLKTAVNLWGNSFDGSKAIEGSISENNTGLDMDVYNATGNSANAWNVKYNARFISDNNALTINVSGTSNQRCAMMQVGHAKNQYAAFLGPLYLNPLGGNVGIGGKSATEKLHVHGNIIATGAITAKSSSSDSRLKKDIADYDALELISRIVAVCFKWNDTARANSEVFRTDAVQYGFIAQQLQEAGLGQFVQDKFGDYLTVDYERFVPIAVKAVQELKSENNSLKSEIDALKADLLALKADLLELKKLVVLR